jgi:D-glycero-alpha-D-manno-heptose-7-phosphate kinase
LNAAISQRAQSQVVARTDGRIRLESVDTDSAVEAASWEELADLAQLPLLAKLAHFFKVRNLTLRTRSESPAGAGIAGSSALNIAVCGALSRWSGEPLGDQALLTIAMNVEAQVINVPTGVQDYRPAYYGGIAAIELGPAGVNRVPLEVDPVELQQRLVLAYTGAPHFSGTNNWEITKRHIDGDRHVFACFDRIGAAAARLRSALTRYDWPGAAVEINQEWEARKSLSPGVTTPAIDALIGVATRAGARAAKVCGAGGGGCLFCLAEPEDLPAVKRAISAAGARVLDYRIEMEGLRVSSLP